MTSTMAARVVACVMAAFSIFLRVGPNVLGAFHFNPVGALSIFGGARLKWWQATLLTLGLMIATDVALEQIKNDPEYGLFHESRIWVYGSYLLCILIGAVVVGGSNSPYRIGTATLLGTASFFLITNFCEWRFSGRYAADETGLLASYAAGLAFLKFSLVADVFFTGLAFAAQALLTRQTKPAVENA